MSETGENVPVIDRGSMRPGKYSRGSQTVDTILQAALHVLVEEGSSAFTLRRIAAECNLQVGNVSRHFPRKEMLVQVLLHELLTSNEDLPDRAGGWSTLLPEEQLSAVIGGILENNRSKKITHLFTELWAMSNHNDFVAERMASLYDYIHQLLGSCIRKINPALNDGQVETLSLFINATLEGTTVLTGYGKPWSDKMPTLKNMSVKWLIRMVKTIQPDEVDLLPS